VTHLYPKAQPLQSSDREIFMTPLVLLVGFLGAGKTTFLKNVLPLLKARGIDPHVVINDYQNARVDASLLEGLAASIQPISGSCVCCGSRDELLGALEGFDHQPNRALLVEANGTTDAEELIEMLSLDPDLRRFTLPIQLSVVDSKRWQKRFWHNALEREQVRLASFLNLSRTDEVDASRVAEVDASLLHHRIEAQRVTPTDFADALLDILQKVRDVPTREAASRAHINDGHVCDEECGHHHHDHAAHREGSRTHSHADQHHFASVQVEFPDSVSRASLEAFLKALPAEVIRAKGLVRLAESPDEFHVFQKVEQFDSVQLFPIGAQSRLSQPVGIFIGPQIQEEAIYAGVAKLTE
jgi:G3E family GTPase